VRSASGKMHAFLSITDVTERRQAEEALAESESRFRTVIENSRDGINMLDLATGRYVVYSSSQVELTGFTREELAGFTAEEGYERVHPEDRHISVEQQRMVAAGEDMPEPVEYRWRVKSGEYRWFSDTRKLVRDVEGRPAFLVGTSRDITERKRAEAERERLLAEVEAANAEVGRERTQLEAVLEATPEPILVYDPDGRITRLNAAGRALVSAATNPARPLAERLAESCPVSADGRPLAPTETVTARALAGERVEGSLIGFDWPGRGRVWYSASAAPIRGAGGRIEGAVAVETDITQLRRTQEQLAQERERLAITLHSIGDGVIATDSAGRVVLMNPVAERLTGWSEAEASGRPLAEVFDVVGPMTGEPPQDPVARVLETGGVAKPTNSAFLISRDGSRYVLAHTAAPIRDSSGMVTGTVFVFQDVTLRHRLEAEAEKANKLESLGVLAGGIAHDFNNLLVGILGNVLLARLDADEASEQYEVLEEAGQAAVRAKSLTQQLLTFAKGGDPLRKEQPLGPVIMEATRFALRGSRNVQASYDLATDLWPAAVDAGQLAQVMHNLVLNATQAMPTGGTITVSAKNRLLSEDSPLPLPAGRYVEVVVRDTGTGIAPGNLRRVFDPYFTTKAGGSGLGLAVCYGIVSKHDGYIGVESEPGQGATFTFYLPASAGEVAEPQSAPLHAGSKGRVLVMDDEDIVLRVAKRTLAKLGYQADVAADGLAAIELYRQAMQEGNPYDVVILDLVVPSGFGGMETLRRLRQEDAGVRAIVCSGYSDDPAMSQFAHFGFAASLGKPACLEEIQAAIDAAMAAS
jgi:PAS domain S-box-containing protein